MNTGVTSLKKLQKIEILIQKEKESLQEGSLNKDFESLFCHESIANHNFYLVEVFP